MDAIQITDISKYRNPIMGFAILWVVIHHIGYVIPGDPISDFIVNMGYGGVDIFMFLSGFGLFYSLTTHNDGILKFYKRRLLRIMPAYFIALCLHFIFECSHNTELISNMMLQLTGLILIIPGHTVILWYIPAIILFYICFPFYYKLLNNRPWSSFIGLSLLSFLLVTILKGSSIYDPNQLGPVEFTIGRIPVFLAGIQAAYLINKDVSKIQNCIIPAIVVFMIAFIVMFILRIYRIPMLYGHYYFVLFFFVTPGLCLVLSKLFSCSKSFTQVFTFFGKYSLEIFLLNGLCLHTSNFFYQYLDSGVIIIPLVIILNIAGAVLLSKGIKLGLAKLRIND